MKRFSFFLSFMFMLSLSQAVNADMMSALVPGRLAQQGKAEQPVEHKPQGFHVPSFSEALPHLSKIDPHEHNTPSGSERKLLMLEHIRKVLEASAPSEHPEIQKPSPTNVITMPAQTVLAQRLHEAEFDHFVEKTHLAEKLGNQKMTEWDLAHKLHDSIADYVKQNPMVETEMSMRQFDVIDTILDDASRNVVNAVTDKLMFLNEGDALLKELYPQPATNVQSKANEHSQWYQALAKLGKKLFTPGEHPQVSVDFDAEVPSALFTWAQQKMEIAAENERPLYQEMIHHQTDFFHQNQFSGTPYEPLFKQFQQETAIKLPPIPPLPFAQEQVPTTLEKPSYWQELNQRAENWHLPENVEPLMNPFAHMAEHEPFQSRDLIAELIKFKTVATQSADQAFLQAKACLSTLLTQHRMDYTKPMELQNNFANIQQIMDHDFRQQFPAAYQPIQQLPWQQQFNNYQPVKLQKPDFSYQAYQAWQARQ